MSVSTDEKPTKIRYWVLAVVCLVYLITYLDRVNISVAAPLMMSFRNYSAVFYLACSLFGLEMAVGVYWAVCLDVGHEYSGTVSAMMNTVGNIGSALSPLVFGAILQFTGSWVYPFVVASCILVAGALLWLKVNPELPVVEELGLGEKAAG